MIITLHEEDREAILDYVSAEPEMNLFFIGDIENYGVESETVNLYVNLEDGKWDCLLLRFHDFYLLYSQDEEYSVEPVAEFLKGRIVDCISGKTSLLKKLAPFYPQWKLESTYMTRCDVINGDLEVPDCGKVRRLTVADVDNTIDLIMQIDEFAEHQKGRREKSCREFEQELRSGCIAVGAFEDGRMVSTARTSADNSVSAMITGVATLKEYRGRGLATETVVTLCREAFGEGKKFLCLFYDNPAAGRIYNRIGFKEMGQYAMLR